MSSLGPMIFLKNMNTTADRFATAPIYHAEPAPMGSLSWLKPWASNGAGRPPRITTRQHPPIRTITRSMHGTTNRPAAVDTGLCFSIYRPAGRLHRVHLTDGVYGRLCHATIWCR